MDLNEIDKEIARLNALKSEALEKENEKKKLTDFNKAKEVIGRLAEDCREVYELGYCPPRLLEALTDEKGKFNPGMYIKRPKAPR